MPWFRVDDTIHDHPKTRAAGPAAMGLWLMCGTWCAHHLTDGVVTADVAREKGGKNWRRMASALVDAGFWHPLDGPLDCPCVHDREKNVRTTRELVRGGHGPGWVFHDYLVYNPTRERVMADREAEAARKRRERSSGGKKRPARTPSKRPNANGVQPAENVRTRPEVPSLPPSGGDGDALSVVPYRSDPTPKTFDMSTNPNARSWRSAEAEAALAAVRRRLPPGHGRRPTPPMDDPTERGA